MQNMDIVRLSEIYYLVKSEKNFIIQHTMKLTINGGIITNVRLWLVNKKH